MMNLLPLVIVRQAAEALEKESGYTLESPTITSLRDNVLNGRWKAAEGLLDSVQLPGSILPVGSHARSSCPHMLLIGSPEGFNTGYQVSHSAAEVPGAVRESGYEEGLERTPKRTGAT